MKRHGITAAALVAYLALLATAGAGCDSCRSGSGSWDINRGADCDNDPITGPGCATGCSLFYRDADGDGYGNPGLAVSRCIAPAGYIADNTDCNDADPEIWVSCPSCQDADGDGYFAGCDAYTTRPGPDCDDGNPTVRPGAPERCGDHLDNQCPGDPGFGTVDENCYCEVPDPADFRVDQGTADSTYPSIATDGNNNYIIAWTDYRNGDADIYARRYDSSGAALGPDFRVDQGTAGAYSPAIAADGDDNFIITWYDGRNADFDVYARRYDSSGAALGPDFRVDQGTSDASYPFIATDGNNNFIVTWEDFRNGNYEIYARRFDSSGAALGPDFRVDQGTAYSFYVTIATDGNHNFIVTWANNRDGDFNIYARRYDSNGAALGPDFRVDQGTSDATYPSIATDGNHNFIITWIDLREGGFRIYARRYDSSGAALGPDFRVDQRTVNSFVPTIATDGNNNFIITWYDTPSGDHDIYARRYDSSGAALGPDFRVDQGTSYSDVPMVATDGNHNFMIAWQDYRHGNWDIYARRYLGDTDCDQLPDSWEDLYSCLDPWFDDQAEDPDSDSVTNFSEYLAHTDPCVP